MSRSSSPPPYPLTPTMPTRATSALLPALAEFRQAIGEPYPGEPAARTGVVDRRHAVRLIEARGSEVDLTGTVELETDLGAALRTEAAGGFVARAEPRRRA